ncbi:MAG TPA: hypothetical protein RMF84_17250 [Polyangiaceae bacterium LLY-WYZ-14_1]|nr:hypothetical protein [Polyangiaceae bacterium LLY-WYZ-14_1]
MTDGGPHPAAPGPGPRPRPPRDGFCPRPGGGSAPPRDGFFNTLSVSTAAALGGIGLSGAALWIDPIPARTQAASPPEVGGVLTIAAPTAIPWVAAGRWAADPVDRAWRAATEARLYRLEEGTSPGTSERRGGEVDGAPGQAGDVASGNAAPTTAPTPTGAVASGRQTPTSAWRAVPSLARGLPQPGDRPGRWRVPLVPETRRPDGSPLPVARVARELGTALRDPDARWLFAPGAIDVRVDAGAGADDPALILGGPGLPGDPETLARRLAAVSFGLELGGAGASFAARPGAGGRRRRILIPNPWATDGGPWLRRVDVVYLPRRRDTLRQVALGRLAGSFEGRSLYGRAPVTPLEDYPLPKTTPIVFIRSRREGAALADDATWRAFRRAVGGRRFDPAGVTSTGSPFPGLPASSLQTEATGARRDPAQAEQGRRRALPRRLRLRVPREDRFLRGVAELLAGVLDEVGTTLDIELIIGPPGGAVDVRPGPPIGDDLTLRAITPPLPGPGAAVAATLVASGDLAAARQLVRDGGLDDPARVVPFARRLDAHVIGHRGDVLSLQKGFRGVRFDGVGRLDLAAIHRVSGDRAR